MEQGPHRSTGDGHPDPEEEALGEHVDSLAGTMEVIDFLFLSFRDNYCIYENAKRLPRELSGKESNCQAGDMGSIPRWGRSPGEGNGNPFQYSCLENPMDRGAWKATVHRVADSDTTKRLSTQ